MGKTRIDMPKIRNQCFGCGERNGSECTLGLSVMCRRQTQNSCNYFRRPSVIEAAKELAQVAGIDIGSIK